MTFKLHIDCDNAAFQPEPRFEIARILREIIDDLERGFDPPNLIHWYQTILDVNGNDVGRYALKRDD